MINFDREFTLTLEARLKNDLNFIQVVIGPRQVGKTTALKTILKRWSGPSLMVTADEIGAPNESWIEAQWNHATMMGDGMLLVFDEIQKVPGWSRIIKVLFDRDRSSRKLKVVLLGSASLSIQQGLSESLVGRYELISAPHWSYSECKMAFGWDIKTYVIYGGYPAAAELISDFSRWQDFIRYGIIEPVLSRDILMIAEVHKPALFRQCFELAMAYPAQEISFIKLLGQLQDKGNVSTVKHYLSLFEGAFLLKTLQKYSASVSRSRQSSPKLLPLNNAFPNALFGKIDCDPVWMGRLFEAAVGAHLDQMEGELFYWRDGGEEVDYVLKTSYGLYAIEVNVDGKKSTYKGLERFKKLVPKAIPMIVDLNQAESFFSREDLKGF